MLNKFDNPLDKCELKFQSDKTDAMTFEGYLSVFGSIDHFGDTIVKGAFSESLEKRTPLLLFGHNPGRVIGIWKDIHEDDKGLRVVGELTPGNTDAQNVHASLKHGAISGLSIGFRTIEFEELESGGRLLKKLDLFEGSVVSMPAEDAARIDMSTVKSRIEGIETIRQAERFLRDEAFFSSPMAKSFISQLHDVFTRDAESAKSEEREIRHQVDDVLSKNDTLIETLKGGLHHER